MLVYLDTSAAMKLVRAESHSAALSDWFLQQPSGNVVSSSLIGVELLRATRRIDSSLLVRAQQVLDGISQVALSPQVLARAAAFEDPELRSLDALHLATAGHLEASTGEGLAFFVAYDERLLASARKLGMNTASPGLP